MIRMPLLTFTEYLYFSGRIDSYDEEYAPSEDDFIEYLDLKNIPEGLKITFDEKYFRTFYMDIELSNRNTTLVRDDLAVEEAHVTAVCDLLAYKLQENVSYLRLFRPEIGGKEFPPPLRNVFNFTDTLVQTSVTTVASLPAKSRAVTLEFMIRAGLVYVDIPFEDDGDKGVSKLKHLLMLVEQPLDLEHLIKAYNICPISPLMYTRLANDILKKADLGLREMENSPLLGMMLESYIKGVAVYQNNHWNLTSHKIGEGREEVDLIDTQKGILCEITVSNKRLSSVHLNKHFVGESYLRILSTRDIEDYVDGIHRIPYPKLCTMFDKGLVNNLFLQPPKSSLTPSSTFRKKK